MTTADRIREAAADIREKYEHERPEWVTQDSPLKYVSWAMEDTITKSQTLATYLSPKPASRVYEFGPGAGYLMAIMRDDYGCDVSGCDVMDRPLYRDMHARLGIETVENARVTPGNMPAMLTGLYNYMIGTQICWMNDWTVHDARWFKWACAANLTESGCALLFPNPGAFGGAGCMQAFGAAFTYAITLPILGEGVMIGPRYNVMMGEEV